MDDSKKVITTKNAALLFGVLLAGVSIICEALFFIGFSERIGDQVLGAIIGGCLVGLQFTFARLAVMVWKTNRFASLPLWVATFLLFLFSVMGTASYFESRFSTQAKNSVHKSVEYQTQKRILNGLLDDKERFKGLSTQEQTKGNDWMAGQHLISASKAANQAQMALKELNAMQPTSETSSAAMGVWAGDDRWVIWWAIACLVDFGPLLCFAYTTKPQKQATTETKTVETKTAPRTVLKPSVAAPVKTRPQSLSNVAESIKTLLETSSSDDLPPVRDITKLVGVGHPKVKLAMAELKAIDFIFWPEGAKTYQLNSNFA